MRLWNDETGQIGIDLNRVTAYILDEENALRVWVGDNNEPYTVKGEASVDDLLEQLNRTQRQVWTSANGAVTLLLSEVQSVLLKDTRALVYMKNEMQTYWTISKKDGQNLRDAWVEHLVW